MPCPWFPPRGKPEKKAVFSPHCGGETTTYYTEPFFQGASVRRASTSSRGRPDRGWLEVRLNRGVSDAPPHRDSHIDGKEVPQRAPHLDREAKKIGNGCLPEYAAERGSLCPFPRARRSSSGCPRSSRKRWGLPKPCARAGPMMPNSPADPR